MKSDRDTHLFVL